MYFVFLLHRRTLTKYNSIIAALYCPSLSVALVNNLDKEISFKMLADNQNRTQQLNRVACFIETLLKVLKSNFYLCRTHVFN